MSDSTLPIRILLFGHLREVTRQSQIELAILPGRSAADVTSDLANRFPNVQYYGVNIRVLGRKANLKTALQPGDVVVFASQFEQTPPYRRFRKTCPDCGSKDLLLGTTPKHLYLVHPVRCCLNCLTEWTPRPHILWSILYFLMGLLFLATAIGCVLSPIWWLLGEGLNPELGSIPRLCISAGVILGGLMPGIVGWGLLRLGLHVLTLPRSELDVRIDPNYR